MAYSGEDLIYQFTLTDTAGTPILFSSVLSMEAVFSSCKKKVSKTILAGGIIEGDSTNSFKIQLEENETLSLGVGRIDLVITFVLPNADFSGGQATSVLKSKIILQ